MIRDERDHEGPMAGIRDASWYNYPRHDHDRASAWAPAYHVEDEEFEGTPACNPNRALLIDMVPAASVLPIERCRRLACRKRFAAARPSVTPASETPSA